MGITSKTLFSFNFPCFQYTTDKGETYFIYPYRVKQLGRLKRICWYKEETLHREEDKPAIIWPDGTKSWYRKGKLHRDGNQPAIIYANGTKKWYREGKETNPPTETNNSTRK